jgi:hypothetical protein
LYCGWLPWILITFVLSIFIYSFQLHVIFQYKQNK